jgi:hypothetical protein
MTPADVENGLKAVKNHLANILEGSSSSVLDQAIAQVHPAAETWRKGQTNWRRRGVAWGYSISRDQPLEFQVCKVRGYDTFVDLSCAFKWPKDPDAGPLEQNVVLRVWTLEKRLYFRQEWDAEQIQTMVDGLGRRVMLRLHFDLANPGQPGPKYHIQVGGNPAGNELCWFPPSVDLPRIPHPPTDLVLACEMIASNFFPEQYRRIRTDLIWRGAIRDTQRSVLQEYFQRCHETVAREQHDQSLLDHLWNEAWQ